MLIRLIIIFVLFAISNTNAIAEVITFERGGFSDSNGIVDQNKLQLELGTFNYYKTNKKLSDINYQILNSLFRYGLIQDRLEFRVRNNGLLFFNTGDNLDVGFDNLALGAKFNLLDERKILPSINLITDFEIPLGAEFSNPGFDHNYQLGVSKSLTNKLSLLFNLGLSFDSFQIRNNLIGVTSMPYVADLSYSLNSKLTLFFEIYGSWLLTSGYQSPLGLASGFTYALKDNLIFDTTLAWGINESANDLAVLCGLAYRF